MANRDRRDNAIRHATDAQFSGVVVNPRLRRRVLREVRRKKQVKKKISLGLVMALMLALMAVTALATALNHYFSGFAELEENYGAYEQWPGSAKVELVQLMLDDGVMTQDDVPDWQSNLSEAEKESVADQALANYFDGMIYLDTYNAMTRELGPIEEWSDEQRALYTSLLEKYGKQKADWPVYVEPEGRDLIREEAVALARKAVLDVFTVEEAALDSMVIDAIFSIGPTNDYGAPPDEPFWQVDFGYGMAYRVYMTRDGKMLGLSAPQTLYIPWGFDVMEDAMIVEPGHNDATRETAIQNARNALTEVKKISNDQIESMDATAQFFYSDYYCNGEEPVWLVTWSKVGQPVWRVLLGYDGSLIDVEPAGKFFDSVLRSYETLSDLWRARCGEMGMSELFENKDGNTFYRWSLEEKAQFSKIWIPIVEAYIDEHPYFQGLGSGVWEWTRNVFGLPDAGSSRQDQALQIACDEVQKRTGDNALKESAAFFYVVTDAQSPQWRIMIDTKKQQYYVTIHAHDGSVLGFYERTQDFYIGDFLMLR